MGPMVLPVHPILVRALLGELDDRGLPVPQVARHAVELLEGLDKLLPQPDTSDLLSLDVEQLSDLALRVTAHRTMHVDLGSTLGWFGTSIVLDLQREMAEHIDPILDAMREPFDQAALEVHAAVQLGILPGLRAPQAILLGPAVQAAWHDLPEHLNVLEDLAALRVRIVDHFDTEPRIDRWAPEDGRPYGACFTSTAEPWVGPDPRETSWDRWLRLCRWEPAHLASVAETKVNAESYAAEPPTPDPGLQSTTAAELHNLNEGRTINYGGNAEAEAEGRVLSRSYP